MSVRATEYYVTTTGSSANNGLTEATAWTWSYAASRLSAGDILWVKAGTYSGLAAVSITSNGTEASPIKIQGYTTTPGDIVSEPYSTFKYGDEIDDTIYPVFEGSDPTSDYFLYHWGDYYEFRNLLFTNYKGTIIINSGADHCTVDNIICVDLGDQTTQTSSEGHGPRIIGNYGIVENCYVENADAEAFSLRGNYGILRYCEVESDNASAPTDYYITVIDLGGTLGSYNEIHHNRLYNRHTASHSGHGYDVKGGHNNYFHDNYSYRTYAAEVNFSLSYDNLFENHYRDGDNTTANGIVIYNGAHDNTFRNFFIKGGYIGVNSGNYQDGASSDPVINPDSGGEDMTFENIVVTGTTKLMSSGETAYSTTAKNATRYTFNNCTFYDSAQGFSIYNSSTEDIVFTNCSLSDISAASLSTGTTFDVEWNYCNFYGNGSSAPSGTSITTLDPQFTDASTLDLTLSASSGLIDIGSTTSATTDYNGVARPQGSAFDIGAFEFVPEGAEEEEHGPITPVAPAPSGILMGF